MSVMFQQELPVYRKVDVVVVGAGPAGIFTALEMLKNGEIRDGKTIIALQAYFLSKK